MVQEDSSWIRTNMVHAWGRKSVFGKESRVSPSNHNAKNDVK